MPKSIMRLEGMDGQVELMNDRIVITRNGIWNALKYGFNATREIPLSAISEVAYRPAGLQLGQIEFVRSGRSTDERKKNNSSAVKFKRSQNKDFERMKEKVFEILNQMQRSK